MRLLLGAGLESAHITFWQRTCLLEEVEFKADGLVSPENTSE